MEEMIPCSSAMVLPASVETQGLQMEAPTSLTERFMAFRPFINSSRRLLEGPTGTLSLVPSIHRQVASS